MEPKPKTIFYESYFYNGTENPITFNVGFKSPGKLIIPDAITVDLFSVYDPNTLPDLWYNPIEIHCDKILSTTDRHGNLTDILCYAFKSMSGLQVDNTLPTSIKLALIGDEQVIGLAEQLVKILPTYFQIQTFAALNSTINASVPEAFANSQAYIDLGLFGADVAYICLGAHDAAGAAYSNWLSTNWANFPSDLNQIKNAANPTTLTVLCTPFWQAILTPQFSAYDTINPQVINVKIANMLSETAKQFNWQFVESNQVILHLPSDYAESSAVVPSSTGYLKTITYFVEPLQSIIYGNAQANGQFRITVENKTFNFLTSYTKLLPITSLEFQFRQSNLPPEINANNESALVQFSYNYSFKFTLIYRA